MEFPHLLRLMDENQFDTIYHEHFSYLSFGTVEQIFAHHGLRLFDVEEMPTHGGSLRIYGCHADDASASERAGGRARCATREIERGLRQLDDVRASSKSRCSETKRKLLEFLIDARDAGKSIVGYGAPGKGNTLLNYCGIRTDFLDYTVDRSPHKQGRYTPGTHIPILAPERIRETQARLRADPAVEPEGRDHREQHAYVREWGGQFVVPIPRVEIVGP